MEAAARDIFQSTSLFDYSDYRMFLSDYYESRKKTRSSWSLSTWARALGLRSKSTLAMILHGQRHPSRKLAGVMASYFSFDREQAEYFSDLVELQKSGNAPGVSLLLMERLAKKRKSGKFEAFDIDRFMCLSQWYVAAIRELTQVHDFRWNADWISHQLNGAITPREVKRAIATLLAVGILERRGKTYVLHSPHVATTTDIYSEGIRRFHEQMLSLAASAIRQTDIAEREITGITFTVRQDDLPRAKQMLHDMANQFADTFESSPGDRVYQLELAFFPLSKKRSAT